MKILPDMYLCTRKNSLNFGIRLCPDPGIFAGFFNIAKMALLGNFLIDYNTIIVFAE